MQWRAFSQQVEWRFLLTLVGGITFSFLILAGFLNSILQHELYRIYLYSCFLGLILASFVLCVRELKRWTLMVAAGLVLGAVAAYSLTGTNIEMEEHGSYAIRMEQPSDYSAITNYDVNHGLLMDLSASTLSAMQAKGEIQADTNIYSLEGEIAGIASDFTFPFKSSYINVWLIFCGAIAICALLLPGISGSYLLTFLGVYPQAIGALADLTENLKHGIIDWESAIILFNLLIGIVVGALCFSHFVSWLLKKFPDITLAILSGFVIGALKSVWPFWSYSYTLVPLKLSKGPQLVPMEPIFPSLDSWTVPIAIVAALSGFALVLFIEHSAKRKVIVDL